MFGESIPGPVLDINLQQNCCPQNFGLIILFDKYLVCLWADLESNVRSNELKGMQIKSNFSGSPSASHVPRCDPLRGHAPRPHPPHHGGGGEGHHNCIPPWGNCPHHDHHLYHDHPRDHHHDPHHQNECSLLQVHVSSILAIAQVQNISHFQYNNINIINININININHNWSYDSSRRENFQVFIFFRNQS